MSRHQGFIAVLAAIVLATACVPAEAVNVSYAAQEAAIGGWDYAYTGNAAIAGTYHGSGHLDGTWSESPGSSAWDGSAPGAGNPGGLGAYTDGSVQYLRIQDAGDPSDHGKQTPDNEKMYFGRQFSSDTELLDHGVTISFRARVPMEAEECQPLDDWYMDDQAYSTPSPLAPLPWAPLLDEGRRGGAGELGDSGGKGMFGIWQSAGLNNLETPLEKGKIISFSLSVDDTNHVHSDTYRDTTTPVVNGLNMNCLSDARLLHPSTPLEDVDPLTHDGDMNLVPITEADGELDDWHEFWITIEPDTTDDATHRVRVWLDGSTVAASFLVTAGDVGGDNPVDFSGFDNAMCMGFTGSRGAGAVDVDFFAVKAGVHQAPEPSSVVLLAVAALCGLFLIHRRR